MTTQKLTLPGSTAKGGWRIDVAAVREAIEFFGLAAPVEIKLAAGTRRKGSHRRREGRHVITLSTYRSPAQASVTLWHELTHAAQSEYLGEDEFVVSYHQASHRYGYVNNPYEVEAREVGDTMGLDHPLTKKGH